MDIPKDKSYQPDSVQCDDCGGWGCQTCGNKGWLPAGHPKGRKCFRDGCEKPIPPNQVAVYCTNLCAFLDADGVPPTQEQVANIAQRHSWTSEETLQKIFRVQNALLLPTVQDSVRFLLEALPSRR